MKRNIYRFTIQFNPDDPRQKQAAEILNRCSPRGKAAVITNLLLGDAAGPGKPPDPVMADSHLAGNGEDMSPTDSFDPDMAEKITSALDLFG